MNEAYPEAAAILEAAGWKPHDGWGVYTRDTLVMGFQPDGQGFHVKNWAKVSEGHPAYGADTPDTPEEAAAWLVNRFQAPTNNLSTDAMLEPFSLLAADAETGKSAGHESDAQRTDPEAFAEAGRAGGGDYSDAGGSADGAGLAGDARHVHLEAGATDAPRPLELGQDILAAEAEAGHSSDIALTEGTNPHDGGDHESGGENPASEPAHEAGSAILDADYTPVPAIEGQDVTETTDPVDAGSDSGVAYFGDNLHVIRLAKIGRVTQVAAEKKAALQFGWDVAEFAYLTNLIVRMDQGLAPDDPSARSRFALISDASRAMSAVDAFAETQVAYLNAASREEVEAFDPEAGWP